MFYQSGITACQVHGRTRYHLQNALLLDHSVCDVLNKKRFVVVGIVLGILVVAAFFVGSPMFGNFDQGY